MALQGDSGSLTLTSSAANLAAIENQVRIFDSRYYMNNWIWDEGTYPPGFSYFILVGTSGVSTSSIGSKSVSDVGHKLVDNGDGTTTLVEQVSVSTDKTDSTVKFDYEVVT